MADILQRLFEKALTCAYGIVCVIDLPLRLIRTLIAAYLCSNHPSWEKRKEYAATGRFDNKLIQMIGKDVSYNARLFERQDIELK